MTSPRYNESYESMGGRYADSYESMGGNSHPKKHRRKKRKSKNKKLNSNENDNSNLSPITRHQKSSHHGNRRGRVRNNEATNQVVEIVPDSLRRHGVTIDENAPMGFVGMDRRYEALLNISNISKQEVLQNPEAVMALLEFHMEGPMPIKTKKAVQSELAEAAEITNVNPKDNFILKTKIGEGAIGTVFKAVDKRTGKSCAIKMVDKEEEKMVRAEIQLQALCRHDNILQYLETYFYYGKLWVVLELMDGGSLTSIISDQVQWEQRYIAYCAKMILRGLNYMHSRYRVHRDIKSDNILVDRKGLVKVADLGNAVTLTSEQRKRKTAVGTPYWMAPEVIMRMPYDSKADIWSVGITIFECCQVEPPYFEEEPLKAVYRIAVSDSPRLKKPEEWSKELNHFIAKTVVKDPVNRCSADQLLMHPFISIYSCKQKDFGKFVDRTLKLKQMKAGASQGLFE